MKDIEARDRHAPQSLSQGYTLIELMIVISIIGILAAIAIPKFADMVRKSQEGATLGNLGALRGAWNIYISANDGVFPTDLGPFMGIGNNKYLPYQSLIIRVPPYHDISPAGAAGTTSGPCNYVYGSAAPGIDSLIASAVASSDISSINRVWNYAECHGSVAPTDARIFINCSHTDSKGTPWSNY